MLRECFVGALALEEERNESALLSVPCMAVVVDCWLNTARNKVIRVPSPIAIADQQQSNGAQGTNVCRGETTLCSTARAAAHNRAATFTHVSEDEMHISYSSRRWQPVP